MKVILILLGIWLGLGCLAAVLDVAARKISGIGFGGDVKFVVHNIGRDIVGGLITFFVMLAPFIASIVMRCKQK